MSQKQTTEQFCAEVLDAQDRADRLTAVAKTLGAALTAANLLAWSDVVPHANEEQRLQVAYSVERLWRSLSDYAKVYEPLAHDAAKYALLMRRRLARRVRP